MLAVFNKKKDSVKTYEEAFALEAELNELYFREIKRVDKRIKGVYFDDYEEFDCWAESFDWERVYEEGAFVEIHLKWWDIISKVREIKKKFK